MELSVIVADDDPIIQDLIADCLADLGVVIRKAATGPQVLKILKELTPALIILDIYMPGLNGLKVATAVRATPQWANIPILILTAYGDRRTLARAVEAGANDFMVKPFTIEVLQEKARKLLNPCPEALEASA